MDESLAGREQEKAKMVFKRCLFEDASQVSTAVHSSFKKNKNSLLSTREQKILVKMCHKQCRVFGQDFAFLNFSIPPRHCCKQRKEVKVWEIISCPSELLMSFFSNTVYDGKNVAKILHQLNLLLLRLRRQQQQQRRKCKKSQRHSYSGKEIRAKM